VIGVGSRLGFLNLLPCTSKTHIPKTNLQFRSPNKVEHLIDCRVIALLEDHMQHVSPSRMEELIKIFVRATELEIRFWDMGLGGTTCCMWSSSNAMTRQSMRCSTCSSLSGTYLNLIVQPVCSRRQHNSRSISSKCFPPEECFLPRAAVLRWFHILDVGQSEDWLALQMALAPCLIGYGTIAKRLHAGETHLSNSQRSTTGLPIVSGVFSISCLERPKEAQ
jgi:hypothetical protein